MVSIVISFTMASGGHTPCMHCVCCWPCSRPLVSSTKDGMTWIEAIMMHPSMKLNNTQPIRTLLAYQDLVCTWHGTKNGVRKRVNENPWRVGDPLRPVFLEGSSAELYRVRPVLMTSCSDRYRNVSLLASIFCVCTCTKLNPRNVRRAKTAHN